MRQPKSKSPGRVAAIEVRDAEHEVARQRLYDDEVESTRIGSWNRWLTAPGYNIDELGRHGFDPAWLRA